MSHSFPKRENAVVATSDNSQRPCQCQITGWRTAQFAALVQTAAPCRQLDPASVARRIRAQKRSPARCGGGQRPGVATVNCIPLTSNSDLPRSPHWIYAELVRMTRPEWRGVNRRPTANRDHARIVAVE